MMSAHFQIGDKVFVKILNNKEGIIYGICFKKNDRPLYKVRYEAGDRPDGYYEASIYEYVGRKGYGTVSVYGDGLEWYSTLGLRGVESLDTNKKYEEAFESIQVSINVSDTSEMVANKTIAAIQIACQHSWRHYDGFSQSFDYCEKCDSKR